MDCTLYNDSVCNLNTKLCDLHSGNEIHDFFLTFLASNGTIDIPNLGSKFNEIKFEFLFILIKLNIHLKTCGSENHFCKISHN